MRIGRSGRIVTGTSLAAIAVIAAMVAWAQAEVDEADMQRRHAGEVTRALSDLRLVTFEYILYRPERARMQEELATEHLERLLAEVPALPPDSDALDKLRERSDATHRLFTELTSASGTRRDGDDVAIQRFEAQLTSRLVLNLQESQADAFRLVEASRARIADAQQRLMRVIAGGLALTALTTVIAAWLIHRKVLVPVRRIEEGTRVVAGGNLDFRLGMTGDDEIGEMARNFDAMTDALRASFAQIERSNQELAALNKEMEAFSYSVSHDLRAPLRSMDGFSMALLEDHGDKLDADGRDSLQRIRNASQRMGRLIDELLGLARVTRTELKLRAVDLSAMARDIAQSLQHQDPGRRVSWRIEDGITVIADRALLQIAMQNLLENAWKFTATTANPAISVGQAQVDGARACFVADNGVGFDMTYADRLFGAFQRMHHESEFPGTGIGLAIVQRIFHRHEAVIWARSTPGQGAIFYFKFRDHHDERSEQGHPPG